MENTRDKYKGLVSLGMSAVLLLGVGAVFTYTWYTAYKGLIDDPFFRREIGRASCRERVYATV